MNILDEHTEPTFSSKLQLFRSTKNKQTAAWPNLG